MCTLHGYDLAIFPGKLVAVLGVHANGKQLGLARVILLFTADLLMVVTLRIDGDHQVMAHGDLKEQFILVLTCISTFAIIFLCTYFIVIIQKYSSKFQKLTIPWNYSSWVREKRNPGCAVAFGGLHFMSLQCCDVVMFTVSGESCTRRKLLKMLIFGL